VSSRIRYSDEAKRALTRLPGRYRQRARRAIEALAATPRPPGAEELRDRPGVFRLWLNGWRIIYYLDEDGGVLLIGGIRLKTGPETYENLDLN
jgi:mRNA interferase RelE/StbE